MLLSLAATRVVAPFDRQRTASKPSRHYRIQRGSVSVRADGLQNMINSLSEVVTNSPVNNLKKGIAKVQAGDYDKAAIKSKIDDYLDKNGVVVFSWTRCPFCKNAKALLDKTGAKYLAVELDTMDDGNAIRSQLAEMTNRTSMPNIFIQGKSYGGCNDGPGVVTLQNQGKLNSLLGQAGAL